MSINQTTDVNDVARTVRRVADKVAFIADLCDFRRRNELLEIINTLRRVATSLEESADTVPAGFIDNDPDGGHL